MSRPKEVIAKDLAVTLHRLLELVVESEFDGLTTAVISENATMALVAHRTDSKEDALAVMDYFNSVIKLLLMEKQQEEEERAACTNANQTVH